MPPLFLQLLLLLSFIFPIISSQCISSGDQTTINTALSAGGTDTIVQLCPNALINLTDTVYFTAPNQEISTVGYPTDSTRATLQLVPGTDTSTLISGVGFSGLRILNIQIDGNRDVTGYLKGGGASIELGGAGTGQRIEYTASRNPRTWSCMHIVESADSGNPCTNATLVNNDIGPCGVEGTEASTNGMWADGISFACTNSLVGSNTVRYLPQLSFLPQAFFLLGPLSPSLESLRYTDHASPAHRSPLLQTVSSSSTVPPIASSQITPSPPPPLTPPSVP